MKRISDELRRRATDAGDEAAIASFDLDRRRGDPPDFDAAVHAAMEAVIATIEAELQRRKGAQQ